MKTRQLHFIKWCLRMGMLDPTLQYNSIDTTYNDSLEASLIDWFILGMYTGMRKSEWCQDRYLLQKNGQVLLNRDHSPSAFILDDFQFEQANGYQCNNNRLASLHNVSLVEIRCRYQKNGNNGEILSFMCNTKNPSRCPVQAALRIRDRAIRLGVPPHLPIAVFKNSKGYSQYVDDFHVTQLLQFRAKQVYNITNSDDLARFTTNSIRVGACVLLHETNQTPDFIKARLR